MIHSYHLEGPPLGHIYPPHLKFGGPPQMLSTFSPAASGQLAASDSKFAVGYGFHLKALLFDAVILVIASKPSQRH